MELLVFNNHMNKQRIVMLVCLVIGFFLSSFLNNRIFVADTPKIKPELKTYLARAFFKEEDRTLSYDSRIQVDELYHRLEGAPFNNVAKGIYVKSEYATVITLYRINEVDWAEYTYEINNKTYKFRVPQNTSPPAKKMF